MSQKQNVVREYKRTDPNIDPRSPHPVFRKMHLSPLQLPAPQEPLRVALGPVLFHSLTPQLIEVAKADDEVKSITRGMGVGKSKTTPYQGPVPAPKTETKEKMPSKTSRVYEARPESPAPLPWRPSSTLSRESKRHDQDKQDVSDADAYDEDAEVDAHQRSEDEQQEVSNFAVYQLNWDRQQQHILPKNRPQMANVASVALVMACQFRKIQATLLKQKPSLIGSRANTPFHCIDPQTHDIGIFIWELIREGGLSAESCVFALHYLERIYDDKEGICSFDSRSMHLLVMSALRCATRFVDSAPTSFFSDVWGTLTESTSSQLVELDGCFLNLLDCELCVTEIQFIRTYIHMCDPKYHNGCKQECGCDENHFAYYNSILPFLPCLCKLCSHRFGVIAPPPPPQAPPAPPPVLPTTTTAATVLSLPMPESPYHDPPLSPSDGTRTG